MRARCRRCPKLRPLRGPAYAAALEDDSGLPVGLRRDGTLSVALDADDYRALEESFAVQRESVRVELLTGQECRRLEPSLNPRIAGGVLSSRRSSSGQQGIAPGAGPSS